MATTSKAATSATPPAVVEKDSFQQIHAHPLQESTEAQAIPFDETEYNGDGDSLYCSTAGSETTSLSPSVFDFVYENGRRYASSKFRKADYFLPNDESEQDRLDLYHHMFLLITGGKLHIAPLDNPQNVLDLGTGTGIWAIDFAQENEQANVIGVDISPIQPSFVPPNCSFEVDDIEEPWTYSKNHFDYIHMRSLSGSIGDWHELLRQIYEHLKPGGIVEFQDYGLELFFHTGKSTSGSGTPLGRWFDDVTEAAGKLGRPLRIARTVKGMMQKAGYVDIHEQVGIWPIGSWPKDKHLKHLGRYSTQGVLESAEPFALQLLPKGKGFTVAQVKELVAEVREDLSSKSPNKYYAQAWFVWGRKPYNVTEKRTK